MTAPTVSELQARLMAAFPDARIEVTDDSHLHAGHAGAASGGGHYSVSIDSARFQGLTTLARHRLVYDSVLEWMPHRIHALAIIARLPAES